MGWQDVGEPLMLHWLRVWQRFRFTWRSGVV